MGKQCFSVPLAATALCVALGGCALQTPGMVGTADGGVVHIYPQANGGREVAMDLAERYCRSYDKRAFFYEAPPEKGNAKFYCAY